MFVGVPTTHTAALSFTNSIFALPNETALIKLKQDYPKVVQRILEPLKRENGGELTRIGIGRNKREKRDGDGIRVVCSNLLRFRVRSIREGTCKVARFNRVFIAGTVRVK